MLRKSAACVALCALLLGTGCFGNFALTRKVYNFNDTINPDKAVKEVTFLGLAFFQVYSLAVVFDALFANTVEFFTGRNPISADAGAGNSGTLAANTPAVSAIAGEDSAAR